MDRDPNIVSSSYSGSVSEAGISVRLEIYRLEKDLQCVLEVVNDAGTSIVWDEYFASDEDAYVAFRRLISEEGMQCFLNNANVIPFPRKH
jgi:hypothetical protein